MKKLALVLALVLAYGSVAAAATPTLSTSVTLAGSHTWTKGNDAIVVPGTQTLTLSTAAKGTGYDVSADFKLWALGAPGNVVLSPTKYGAKLTDGGVTVNIWGGKDLSGVATPFGFVSASKTAGIGDFRARAQYQDFTLDLSNSTARAFDQKKLSGNLTVGGAIQKDLNGKDDGNGTLDAWATSKVGTIDLSGELAATPSTKTNKLSAKATTPVAMGIVGTEQVDYSKVGAADAAIVSTTTLAKADAFLTGVLTMKNDVNNSMNITGTRDTGLNYIQGVYDKAAVTTVSATVRARGSNDQAWGDVFSLSSGKWLKNKTWAVQAMVSNAAALKAGADQNPATSLTLDAMYVAIKDKAFVKANFSNSADKDGAANVAGANVNSTSISLLGKYNVNSKIDVNPSVNLSSSSKANGDSASSATVAATVNYTMAPSMVISGSVSNASSSANGVAAAPAQTYTLGYSLAF